MNIEDYALIGDCETGALVGRDGSIDWLCWPDFSSPACFAALLGTKHNGRWLLAPRDQPTRIHRRYRERTMILDTEFETESGRLLLTDFMPVRGQNSDVVRIVRCTAGRVAVRMELCVRFDYGRTTPWTGPRKGCAWTAAAGIGAVFLRTRQAIREVDGVAAADFVLHEGEERSFVLTYGEMQGAFPRHIHVRKALNETTQFWNEWCSKHTYAGQWQDAMERSLMTLKALTYRPSGGIVAAPTTSLPERFGGDLNWDYRYCWLRDGAFTLESLLAAGHEDEATAWQEWLLQSVGSNVRGMQIMYGVHGERHLPEIELPWLPGYRKSPPVRIGNAASEQLQVDVYGEVADAIYCMERAGMQLDERLVQFRRQLTDFVAEVCHRPASGLWEERGKVRHFTYSKMMAWLALDHGVKGTRGRAAQKWKAKRDRLFAEICRRGFDKQIGSFVQSYGSQELDASALLMPTFGFLPYDDDRVVGTQKAIERKLMREGLICRFVARGNAREGCFVACSFWMVQNLAGMGRWKEAEAMFERLLRLRNDVGLLAEEYDVKRDRFAGNFPQALSHIALLNAGRMLAEHDQRGKANSPYSPHST